MTARDMRQHARLRTKGERQHSSPSESPITKAEACDLIASRMSGREWNADCMDDVVDALQRAGYTVREFDDLAAPTCRLPDCDNEVTVAGTYCSKLCRVAGEGMPATIAAKLHPRDVQEYLGGGPVPDALATARAECGYPDDVRAARRAHAASFDASGEHHEEPDHA